VVRFGEHSRPIVILRQQKWRIQFALCKGHVNFVTSSSLPCGEVCCMINTAMQSGAAGILLESVTGQRLDKLLSIFNACYCKRSVLSIHDDLTTFFRL